MSSIYRLWMRKSTDATPTTQAASNGPMPGIESKKPKTSSFDGVGDGEKTGRFQQKLTTFSVVIMRMS